MMHAWLRFAAKGFPFELLVAWLSGSILRCQPFERHQMGMYRVSSLRLPIAFASVREQLGLCVRGVHTTVRRCGAVGVPYVTLPRTEPNRRGTVHIGIPTLGREFRMYRSELRAYISRIFV